MNRQEVLALFDREQRREVVFPDVRREESPGVVRHVMVEQQVCVIIYSSLNMEDADATIQREMDQVAVAGFKLSWKAYAHDRPADLRDRLVAHGLAAQELEAVLVLDMVENDMLLRSELPPGIDIRPVTGEAQIGDVIAIEEEVWQDEHTWLHDLAHELETYPFGMSMYAAYIDGLPASAGWIRYHVGSQFASLWGGSTRAMYRGRGLYTALLAVRAREARARGLRYLTIDASPMSRPIVEKFGFELITYAQDHDWQP